MKIPHPLPHPQAAADGTPDIRDINAPIQDVPRKNRERGGCGRGRTGRTAEGEGNRTKKKGWDLETKRRSIAVGGEELEGKEEEVRKKMENRENKQVRGNRTKKGIGFGEKMKDLGEGEGRGKWREKRGNRKG